MFKVLAHTLWNMFGHLHILQRRQPMGFSIFIFFPCATATKALALGGFSTPVARLGGRGQAGDASSTGGRGAAAFS